MKPLSTRIFQNSGHKYLYPQKAICYQPRTSHLRQCNTQIRKSPKRPFYGTRQILVTSIVSSRRDLRQSDALMPASKCDKYDVT